MAEGLQGIEEAGRTCGLDEDVFRRYFKMIGFGSHGGVVFQANAGLRRLSAREAYAGGGFEIVGKAVEYQQDAVAGVDIDAGPHLFGKAEMALTLFNGCWQRNEGKRFGSPKCLHGKAAHHGHKDSGLHGGKLVGDKER